MRFTGVTKLSPFAEDVCRGLSTQPKSLPSKYFYDDEGTRLFQEIMQLPEYYLTRAEREIFQLRAPAIYEAFASSAGGFDLIELGAGDGAKTALLIEYFLRQAASFTYSPIDISPQALACLTHKFTTQFPGLRLRARTGDYFQMLETLQTSAARRRVLMFLGSSIGNYSHEQAIAFFRRLRAVMNPDDLLFTGFDLQKDPRVIVRAYDDAQGVTAKFNLNLLRRLNRELGADFKLEKFSHYETYRPNEGTARSFLISRETQEVFIQALARRFHFKQWEPIFVEVSQKYSLEMIAGLAHASGFRVAQNFFDSRAWFTDSLWTAA